MRSNLGWLGVIGLSLVSPAALLLAPFIFLLQRDLTRRSSQVDSRTGLNRFEHARYNPGVPFIPHR
jgi:hypothetical protein